ncbi:DNA repair protein rhp42-like protein [Euroglyphus maynei]|uniref:DNA repair protein rhp42-like protein n=1 Tax=Euroglyphus maynei TaxID=6958 RepID=A0A1Y3B3W3_EURMA|nr:DNA repair protein rhp42-like protein [Euroglyphus maynei]
MEIFDDTNNHWICYDYQHRIYDKPKKLSEKFPIKPTYILAIDNDDNIVEVTARYATDWLSNDIEKRRINDGWLEETLNIFVDNNNDSKYKEADNIEFEKIIAQIELPKRISEYKNHPLFVLTRDLLKFQAIYPSDAPPLGFFRDEPVYSRNCVHTLKSRETWLREARTVRLNERPYKIVQSRFKWKATGPGEQPEKEMIGVFGEWQTIPYEPPIAKNGIVPRNGYGNVDLYKICMLPIGTVHLQLPGLLRIANKLKIDCVPAIVGFEGTCNSHPIMDGYVVCNEYKDILIDAWKQDQQIQNEKEREKRLKRIMENWKRIIRGLIIKRNLKIKYAFLKKNIVADLIKKKRTKSIRQRKMFKLLEDILAFIARYAIENTSNFVILILMIITPLFALSAYLSIRLARSLEQQKKKLKSIEKIKMKTKATKKDK